VVVSTAAETILFSPDDVDGFLQTIGAPASAAAPLPAGTFRQPPGLRWIQRVFWGVVIASLIPVPVILLYSPGAPGYTLTPNQLSIHDRFFPVTLAADAIDVGQIRLVDLAQDRDWRPVRRTRGFANRRYQSGWFQLASGATARVYRAGGNRMVLLPPRGAGVFVLYQAQDPDALVMELRREWSGR